MLAGDVTSWWGVHWCRSTLISFLVKERLLLILLVKQIIIAGVTPLVLLWIKVNYLLLMWISFGLGGVNSRFSRFMIIYFFYMFWFVSDWTSGKDLLSPFVAQWLQSWPTWSKENQQSDNRNSASGTFPLTVPSSPLLWQRQHEDSGFLKSFSLICCDGGTRNY